MGKNLYIDYINNSIDDKTGTNLVNAATKLNDLTIEMGRQYNTIIDQLMHIQSIITNLGCSQLASELTTCADQISSLQTEITTVEANVTQLNSDQSNLLAYLSNIESALSVAEDGADDVNTMIHQFATQKSVPESKLMIYPS